MATPGPGPVVELSPTIIARRSNLEKTAKCRGLNVLGIGTLVNRHPEVARQLFVLEKVPLTVSTFMDLV